MHSDQIALTSITLVHATVIRKVCASMPLQKENHFLPVIASKILIMACPVCWLQHGVHFLPKTAIDVKEQLSYSHSINHFHHYGPFYA